MPDGRKAKITGPTRQGLVEKARVIKDQGLAQDASQIAGSVDIGGLETAGRVGTSRFLDTFFEAPEDILNFASEQAKRLPPSVQAAPGLGQAVTALRQAPGNVDIPNPQASDVFAVAQLAGEAAGAVRSGDFGQFSSFQQAKEQQQAQTEQAIEQNPIASALGQAAGDAATLVTGRAPLAVARRNAQLRQAPKTEQLAPGAKQLARDIFQSDKMKSLKRATGKAAETGLEGATLAILNDGDPIETAGWVAGGQLVGSLGLEVFPPTKRGAVNFAVAVGSVATLLRFGQEFSPGENSVWTAVDQSFNKMKYGLIAGLGGAFVGAGRIGTSQGATSFGRSLQRNAPAITDSITAIPRGMVVSMTNEILKDGNEEKVTALETMAQNPERFDEAIQKRIERAIKKGNLPQEMDKLMKNERFREAIGQ
jgi:hypothetical protein